MFQNNSGNSDDEDTEDSDEEDSMETGNSTPRVARKRKQVCYCHLTSFYEYRYMKRVTARRELPGNGNRFVTAAFWRVFMNIFWFNRIRYISYLVSKGCQEMETGKYVTAI